MCQDRPVPMCEVGEVVSSPGELTYRAWERTKHQTFWRSDFVLDQETLFNTLLRSMDFLIGKGFGLEFDATQNIFLERCNRSKGN